MIDVVALRFYEEKTERQGGTYLTQGNLVDTADCAFVSRLLANIGDKWTMPVVRSLSRGPQRFNALRRDVGDISQKVLASTLRDLQTNGFISRTVTSHKPPQVEYALTALGEEFVAPVLTLAEWLISNSDRIVSARVSTEPRPADTSPVSDHVPFSASNAEVNMQARG